MRLWPAAASVSCLVLFMGVAAAVVSGVTLPFDDSVRFAIHGWTSNPLTHLAVDASVLGSVPMLTALFAIGEAGFLLARNFRPAIALASTMAGAIVLDNGIKYAVHRPRPDPFFGIAPESYSFPSGHVLFSACFYGALAFILTASLPNVPSRAAIWAAAALLVSAIGWSRLYLGVHYPTDVIGGLLIAGAWLAALQSAGLLGGSSARGRSNGRSRNA